MSSQQRTILICDRQSDLIDGLPCHMTYVGSEQDEYSGGTRRSAASSGWSSETTADTILDTCPRHRS